MNRKQQSWLPFLLGITMSLGIFFGFRMRDKFPNESFFSNKKPTNLQEVLYLINEKYVDDINAEDITDTVIQTMVNKLDPHSEYMSHEDLKSLNEQLDGHFSGIGIEFDIFHDTLQVTYVIPNGPADKAGLQCGDQIISVNNNTISGIHMESESIKYQIKGKEGTVANVKYKRGASLNTTNITRGNIDLSSLDAYYMMDDHTGYIRLNKFSNQTYKEFMTALMDLKKNNMTKLILDLRNNGGGILDQAIEIADEFLSDDKLITYTEGKHSPRKNYTCKREGQFETGDLIVLCNEGSASASEVLMGALQDWDRATIVGQRSFGKGLVQEVFELRDQSALKLTVARYYTPTGRCIQRPYQNGQEAYYSEVSERRKNGFNKTSDAALHDKGRIYTTPKGKKLYGGGGISPDIVTLPDSSQYSDNTFAIYSLNLITPFSIQYYLQHKSTLGAYQSASDFAKNFKLDEASWNQFTLFISNEGIKTSALTTNEKLNIENTIKANIGKQIWGRDGAFIIMNESDEDVLKGKQLLSK